MERCPLRAMRSPAFLAFLHEIDDGFQIGAGTTSQVIAGRSDAGQGQARLLALLGEEVCTILACLGACEDSQDFLDLRGGNWLSLAIDLRHPLLIFCVAILE